MKLYQWQGHDYEVVSYETKRGKQLDRRCENYDGYWLYQVYNSYSVAKEVVWEYWHQAFCKDINSDNFAIVSHNCQTFSLGWFTTLPEPLDNGLSREVSILITPRHNYMIVYPE